MQPAHAGLVVRSLTPDDPFWASQHRKRWRKKDRVAEEKVARDALRALLPPETTSAPPGEELAQKEGYTAPRGSLTPDSLLLGKLLGRGAFGLVRPLHKFFLFHAF